MPSIGNATLCVDWRGRAREREIKLQLLGVTRNPLRGLAWSSVRTRGKVATFGVPAGPQGSRATLCVDWRGQAHEREVKLQLSGLPQGSRATLCVDWRGRAREREVKLQLSGFPQGSRATLCGDWRGRVSEREVKLLLFGFPQGSRAT